MRSITMQKSKSISLVLTMVFMFTIVFGSCSAAVASPLLKDIQGHWAQSTIEEMVGQQIVNGYPDATFKPDGNISRAEFATLIVKAFNLEAKNGKVFNDTAKHWAKSAISTANAYGIVSGYSATSFGPDDPITREQMAVMVVKAGDYESSNYAVFTDSSKISAWAKTAVNAAYDKGIIKGMPDGSFAPQAKATRAQAAVVLNASLKVKIPETKKIVTPEFDFSSIDKAGTYGPKTGTKTIEGNVTIKSDGVVLQNLIIKGDLIIAEAVGDGDVTLNNVAVKGKTYVRGGGKDSIHINGGQYSEIIIEETATGQVRIVATNTQGIKVTIADNAKGEEIILKGDIKKVTVKADDVKIITQGDTQITEFTVQSGLKDVNIELSKDTTIKEIVLDSKVTVKGEGTIKEASGTQANDSTFNTKPETISKPTSGGGGGGGGGGESSSTVAVSAISVTPTTMTLTAGGKTGIITASISPNNATNKKVNWTTSDAKAAAVNENGAVTPIAVGTATITATSAADSSKKASCVVTVAVPATWKATGNVGTHTIDGVAYVFQEFELLADSARVSLALDNVTSINVDGKALEPNTDETLWMNVQKASGTYEYTVITKAGVTYVATLNWTAPASVDATKTNEPAYNKERGNWYQLYTVPVDVTPKDSKVYQIKPDGEISELTVLTDNDNNLNIWFRLYGTDGAQQAGNHVFLIKKGETWSKAVISHGHTQATWGDTGKVGTHSIDGKAYVFQGFKLLDGENRIDLVASNIEKMTVLEPGAEQVKILTVEGETDSLLWFNVQKTSGDYKYTVTDKDGKVYEATLSWTAPAEVTATKTGEPAYNAERQETYQLYTVQIDVTPEDSKVYQIKPDGTISELTVLANNDNHLNIWFRLSGGVGPQQEGDHVFLIKKGETWSKAVINYKTTEDPMVAAALAAVNNASSADNYAEVKTALEENAAKLGLDLTDYNKLDPEGRKNAVANDIYNNKPEGDYSIETLKPMFDEIVATRMVFQNSVGLFAAASETSPLTDLSYITMLQENLNAVTLQKVHSGRSIKDDILPELNGLVNDFNALTAEQKTAVLKGMNYSATTSSTATRNALKAAITRVKTVLTERLTITGVTIVDNKAYASTAAQGGTVRVLGYGIGINLDAKSEGKKVSDTTSIVIELFNGENLLGQQSFNEAGYSEHADKSAISGTIDAGGQYVATSWANSWSAEITDIPTKAVATVQYTDGTAIAEMALNFTDTKIFEAAEAVYALFTNPLADVEKLTLTAGVTEDAITAAETKVTAVGEGSSHKILFKEMITKANSLFEQGSGNNGENGGTGNEQ